MKLYRFTHIIWGNDFMSATLKRLQKKLKKNQTQQNTQEAPGTGKELTDNKNKAN